MEDFIEETMYQVVFGFKSASNISSLYSSVAKTEKQIGPEVFQITK